MKSIHQKNIFFLLTLTVFVLMSNLTLCMENKSFEEENSAENSSINKPPRKKRKIDISKEEKEKSYQEQNQCEICNKKFKHKKNLNQHLQIHSDKSYKCIYCNKILQHERSLPRHMQLHSDKTPYKCDDCGKTFKLKDTLTKHINAKHEKNKEYICNYALCDSTFKTRSGLVQHIKVQHQKIYYNCSQCNQIFTSNYGLKQHVESQHTKKKAEA